jgi:hypothetical protein
MTPPPAPDKKQEKPAQNAPNNPTVSAQKPKHQPPPDTASKMKKGPPQERVQPPAPGPKNAPPKDQSKKQKKNAPAASPTP